jgi:hypothetical protein
MIGVGEKKSHSLQELKDNIARDTAYISKTTVPLHIKIWALQVLHRSKKLTLARLFHKIKEGKLQAKKNNSKLPVDTGFLCNNTSITTAILVIRVCYKNISC